MSLQKYNYSKKGRQSPANSMVAMLSKSKAGKYPNICRNGQNTLNIIETAFYQAYLGNTLSWPEKWVKMFRLNLAWKALQYEKTFWSDQRRSTAWEARCDRLYDWFVLFITRNKLLQAIVYYKKYMRLILKCHSIDKQSVKENILHGRHHNTKLEIH